MWRKCILKFLNEGVGKTPPDITSDIFNSEPGEHQMLSNCIHDMLVMVVLSLVTFWWRRLKAGNARLSTAIQCLLLEGASQPSLPYWKAQENEPRKDQILKPSHVYTLEVTRFFSCLTVDVSRDNSK